MDYAAYRVWNSDQKGGWNSGLKMEGEAYAAYRVCNSDQTREGEAYTAYRVWTLTKREGMALQP